MKNTIKTLRGWLPDALMVGGAASMSYGAALVYMPAGWVVAGLFGLAGGILLSRGGKSRGDK